MTLHAFLGLNLNVIGTGDVKNKLAGIECT
jgi:hypothetical protein